MRVSSRICPLLLSIGTLKSTRTSTRLFSTSMSRTVFLFNDPPRSFRPVNEEARDRLDLHAARFLQSQPREQFERLRRPLPRLLRRHVPHAGLFKDCQHFFDAVLRHLRSRVEFAE